MKPFALALIAALAASCSSAGPVALADYCARWAKVTCNAADHCGCLDATTRPYCETFQTSQCQGDVVDKVSSGKRAYDAGAAGQCLADLQGVLGDCSLQGDDMPASCDQMLVGAVAAGQACDEDGDCSPPLECHSSVCTAMPGDGQACLGGTDCATDLFCGGDGLCHARRGRGGDCAEGDYACADQLYCDPTTTTCQPLIGSGGSCAQATWACADGLYCSPAAHTCKAYPGRGGDCADSSQTCADGLYCDATGVCRDQLDAGASCTDAAQCKSDDCSSGVCNGSGSSCPFL